MTRRNPQGREIWFDRWLWSYMPSHWKGWALIGGLVSVGIASAMLVDWLFNTGADGERFPIGSIGLMPIILLGLWFAERHSPPRR